MSIESLGGVYGPPTVIPRTPALDGPDGTVGQKPTAPLDRGGAAQDRSSSPETSLNGGLPMEAPPGTDPDLWSVLTAEERQYFARAKTLGPVTYSPKTLGMAELGIQRGGRLDVKV